MWWKFNLFLLKIKKRMKKKKYLRWNTNVIKCYKKKIRCKLKNLFIWPKVLFLQSNVVFIFLYWLYVSNKVNNSSQMSDKVKLFCEAKNYVKLFKILRKRMRRCLGRLELFTQNHGFGKRLVQLFVIFSINEILVLFKV